MRITTLTALAACGWLTLGCGPSMIELESDGETSTGVSTSDPTPTSADPTATTGPTGPTSISTTEPDPTTSDDGPVTEDGGYEDDGDGTGCTFTCPDPPPPPPMGGMCNCPEGEKCMPWSNDGTEEWNSIRCSPIDDDPGQPGEACTVEGYQWSGIDDCDYDSLCLVTDFEANTGVCVAFCSWLGEGSCGENFECQTQPGDLMIPLCAPVCDPTVPDCPMGQGCFPGGAAFTCQTTAKVRVPVGMPCSDPTMCEAGAMCVFGPSLSCGQAGGEGCCGAVCDTTAPDPCPMPTTCTGWFGDAGPDTWAHVGYCG